MRARGFSKPAGDEPRARATQGPDPLVRRPGARLLAGLPAVPDRRHPSLFRRGPLSARRARVSDAGHIHQPRTSTGRQGTDRARHRPVRRQSLGLAPAADPVRNAGPVRRHARAMVRHAKPFRNALLRRSGGNRFPPLHPCPHRDAGYFLPDLPVRRRMAVLRGDPAAGTGALASGADGHRAGPCHGSQMECDHGGHAAGSGVLLCPRGSGASPPVPQPPRRARSRHDAGRSRAMARRGSAGRLCRQLPAGLLLS